MGYTTEFAGVITVEPALNAAEVSYLRRFAGTRRMKGIEGPYFVERPGLYGQDHSAGVIDHDRPPEGQPGLWCQWEPTDDGTAITWNGVEKFYAATKWMAYLIDHFLKPGAVAASVDDQQFCAFTFDHVLNGTISAEGEDSDDRWRLIVRDNVVSQVEV